MPKFLSGAFLILLLGSCSIGKEATMPFYNLGYTSSRLQPINLNSTTFSFRVWVNNGTSIERVISISIDTTLGQEGSLKEIGTLFRGNWRRQYYNSKTLVPKSGFKNFVALVDSMGLFTVPNQEEIDFPMHKPFSFYVLELKDGDLYHSFKFYTYFPTAQKTGTAYDKIEEMIMREFPFEFYKK